jgi:hypothetical protein
VLPRAWSVLEGPGTASQTSAPLFAARTTSHPRCCRAVGRPANATTYYLHTFPQPLCWHHLPLGLTLQNELPVQGRKHSLKYVILNCEESILLLGALSYKFFNHCKQPLFPILSSKWGATDQEQATTVPHLVAEEELRESTQHPSLCCPSVLVLLRPAEPLETRHTHQTGTKAGAEAEGRGASSRMS